MTEAVVLQISFAAAVAFAQQRSEKVVLSVCEAINEPDRYAGAAVAVVGRMERSVSTIDQYEFLSQDGCAHPVVIHGHTCSNKIFIETEFETGKQPPPVGWRMDRAELAVKLSEVRKTTTLGSHHEPRLNKDGTFSTVTVPNTWAVVYGRVVRPPDMRPPDVRVDCGGFDSPLLILANPSDVRRLTPDGRTSDPNH